MAAGEETQVDVLMDNWLLQNAARFLSGNEDPSEEASWIRVTQAGAIQHFRTRLGVIHVESLFGLLDQLVLSDRVFVMQGWSETWRGELAGLDRAAELGVVCEVPGSDDDLAAERMRYLDLLCTAPALRAEHEAAMAAWEQGEPRFIGQVTNGTAQYLAIADRQNLSYVPHPVRTLFMKNTLYAGAGVPAHTGKLTELVCDARLKLDRLLRPDSEIVRLRYRLSPVALLCVQESKPGISPLEVALQLREDKAFRELRRSLSRLMVGIRHGDGETALSVTREFAQAIKEVERQKQLRSHVEDIDGPRQITAFKGLPLRVPHFMKRPLFTPKHTSVLRRLVDTGTRDLMELLRSKLGLNDPLILEDMRRAWGTSDLLN